MGEWIGLGFKSLPALNSILGGKHFGEDGGLTMRGGTLGQEGFGEHVQSSAANVAGLPPHSASGVSDFWF